VEGTSGAADFVLFRERAGKAALQGEPGASPGSLAGRFERSRPLPHGRQKWPFQAATGIGRRHEVPGSSRLG
jgi:hypothetical protein